MIDLRHVHKRFGPTPVLRGVDLCVPAGKRVGIMGPAGSGKSLLIKLCCGLLAPDAGCIVIGGRDITGLAESELAQVRGRIGMLFQNNALFDFMTVGENVAFPLRQRGCGSEGELGDRVAERLRAVGLLWAEHKMPAELSGGMKKRVGIARATITRPDIVFYDEPSAGLDPVTTAKIYDLLLADHAATGATVVAVSSDVEALLRFTESVAMMHEGTICYQGLSRSIRDAADPAVRQFVRGDDDGPL